MFFMLFRPARELPLPSLAASSSGFISSKPCFHGSRHPLPSRHVANAVFEDAFCRAPNTFSAREWSKKHFHSLLYRDDDLAAFAHGAATTLASH